MQITRAGEYGVLGLLALSRRSLGEVAMIDVIAAEEEVPVSFLGKIFQSLARAGIVKSARGSGGGFALARDPSEITILQVIEAIEGPIALQRCLDDDAGCENITGCALCGLLTEAQDRVKEVFQATTLRELAGRHLPAGLMRQARIRGGAPSGGEPMAGLRLESVPATVVTGLPPERLSSDPFPIARPNDQEPAFLD